MVSSTVNNTDEVWLISMNDAGTSVNVEGTALSSNAVANLMTNLMKTGYFKSVEIKEAYQDEAEKKVQAFNFSLTWQAIHDRFVTGVVDVSAPQQIPARIGVAAPASP